MKALFLSLLLAANCVAAPLIFKGFKDLTPGTFVEVASFNAAKYKQIRIGISSNNVGSSQSIHINGWDGGFSFQLLYTDEAFLSRTFLIDVPPESVNITIDGKGKYYIRVWGIE